jgi:hypothetical protein
MTVTVLTNILVFALAAFGSLIVIGLVVGWIFERIRK